MPTIWIDDKVYALESEVGVYIENLVEQRDAARNLLVRITQAWHRWATDEQLITLFHEAEALINND